MVKKLLALLSAPPLPRTHLALCKVSPSGDGKAPEWIELVPAGDVVAAVDGRKFKNPNPQRIVDAFRAYKLDLPIDYEHSSERKGPNGDEAPAAGWITELEVRNGSIWGRVDWTPKGTASLTGREYRYISPAFMHTKDGTITELVSAGLTNKPALNQLAAVAARLQGESMDPKLLKLLGLSESATVEQVLAACQAMADKGVKLDADLAALKTELATARVAVEKASAPDLNKFVPRADYDAALARATTAEKAVTDEKALKAKIEIETEIEAALKAGKITPATADYHRASCAREGGLALFRDFVKSAPVVAGDGKVKEPAAGGGAGDALTEAELAIATRCGMTPETFRAAKKSQ